MCCRCARRRCVIIFASLWTFLQSLCFAALGIVAVLAHNCELDMTGSPYGYLMYLTYFRHEDCGPFNWAYLGLTVPAATPVPIMPEVSNVVYRNNIFMITFVAISLAWAITSILLIFGLCMSCLGKCGYRFLILPYVVFGILAVILDATASGFYIYDVVNTVGTESYLRFIEVANIDVVLPHLELIDSWVTFTYIPSVTMLLVASRALIFWGLNIACICFVISFGNEYAKNIPKQAKNNQPAPIQRPDFGYERDEQMQIRPTAVSAERRYSDQAQYDQNDQRYYNHNEQPNYDYDNEGFANDRPPPQNQQQMFVAPVYAHQPQQRNYSQQPYHQEPENNNRGILKTTTAYGNKSVVPLKQDNEQNRTSMNRPVPPPKPKGVERTSQVPPEALRSQLPWSYTSNRDDSAVRKTYPTLEEIDDLPPVPVPDYTLHFPKDKRASAYPKEGNINKRFSSYQQH